MDQEKSNQEMPQQTSSEPVTEFNEDNVTAQPDVSLDDASEIKEMSVEEQLEVTREACTELSEGLLRNTQHLDGLSQHYQQTLDQIHGQFLDMSVRLSVFEFLTTHEDCKELREKFVNGELSMDDLKGIAENHVIPMIQKRREEAEAQAEAQRAEHEARIREAMKGHGQGGPGYQAPQIIINEDGDTIPVDMDEDTD